MLARVNAIALNTFREAIRHRILYLLLIFAVVMISFAQILSLLTVGSEEKIIKDFGLASIDLFGVLTSVFIGIGLVSREIERRTVYTLLAKPLHRFEFVIGKFAGLAITLLVNTGVMALWFCEIRCRELLDFQDGSSHWDEGWLSERDRESQVVINIDWYQASQGFSNQPELPEPTISNPARWWE